MENLDPYLTLFSLKGKVAIITGAGGYFGKAFCEVLLAFGAKIVMLGRGGKISRLAQELRAKYQYDRVDYFTVDFYNDEEFRRCLLDVVNENTSIDILVNNAFDFSKQTGFNDNSGRIENMSKLQWMTSLESGVYWPALAIQIIAEKMKLQRSGSIINISSMYGLVSPDPKLYEGVDTFNPPSYGASKAAILALTKYTASFYGKYGLRCNAIVPGSFPNIDQQSFNAPRDSSFIERLRERTVLDRYGDPEDLKGPLVFLSSDASSYMTGQALVVDGGWTII